MIVRFPHLDYRRVEGIQLVTTPSIIDGSVNSSRRFLPYFYYRRKSGVAGIDEPAHLGNKPQPKGQP